LLTLEELKDWLHRDLTQLDKALLLLGSLNKPAQISDIRELGRNAGLREIDKWNLSYLLGRANGLAINAAAGWEISKGGRQRLKQLGIKTALPPSRQEILRAADSLSSLGHLSFDRMLLQLGIDDLRAGREVGSLSSRANALAAFALANPTSKTADGIPIGNAIVDYAQSRSVDASDGPKISVAQEELGAATPIQKQRPSNKVFLVHGRDSGAMHEVARFLEKIGVDVTILHERPNKGRALISKFEDEASDISYAVVLMTPDDVGGLKGEKPTDRARQNVVFELGFFIGRLGAQNVCALVKPGVERPSDFEAVVYVELDGGKWKTELARELRAAGVPFDYSKVF
jgi:predicted nucleotide-binding protein